MASNPANTTVNLVGAGISHMPKLLTVKTKYVRARPRLMTRSVAFMTGGNLIFVLQANKVSPKTQKGRDRFRYLHTKNTNSVENTGHSLKFAVTRRTYDAKLAEAIPDSFIRHFERRVVGSNINYVR